MKKLAIPALTIMAFLGWSCLLATRTERQDTTVTKGKGDTLSFDRQMAVFNALGYTLNPGITKQLILEDMKGDYAPGTDLELQFRKSPFVLLYYYLGWSHSDPPVYYTNNCIWYDLEFIDPSTEYITFMKRMGDITGGELTYTDISLTVDERNYEWITFKVNGAQKTWELAQVGYVDDSFFQRFSYLTREFSTKGRYTYFDDGGQQFVIDYATEEEQLEFIEKTGIQREWLGNGEHFSDHIPGR